MNLRETYNRIAEDWFRDHTDDTWWISGTDHFLSILPKNSNVLDVGCGAGIKTRYISDRGFGVSGMDFSEKMIDIARRENPEIDFKVGDVYELDKVSGNFDGVFAQAVLLHIPKARAMEVLEKMKSRLKPNGFLYIAVKAVKEDNLEEDVVRENDYGYEYERFFSYYTLTEIKQNLEKLGMDLVWEDESGTGKSKWLQVIARKK